MVYIRVRDLTVAYKIGREVFTYLTDNEAIERLLRQFESAKWKLELYSGKSGLEDKLRNLFKAELERFNKTGEILIYAIDGLNMDVKKGKFLSIIGESGSGKSTLALALLGVFPRNAVASGAIELEGKDILKSPEDMKIKIRAKKIGYIGELSKKYLNPLMFNAIQILEAALLASDDVSEAVKKTSEAARRAGIDKRILLSLPTDISMGQLSKVAYALAISKNPELLVADEPFRGLDIYQASALARYLREIADESNSTTILFTHRIDLALEISDEIAVMYRGKIIERGPVEKIYKHPIHPYTKGMIGAIPNIRYPKRELTVMPGETLPNLVSIDFCPFYNRCPVRREECLDKMPDMKEVDGQSVACYAAEEIKDISPWDFWKD